MVILHPPLPSKASFSVSSRAIFKPFAESKHTTHVEDNIINDDVICITKKSQHRKEATADKTPSDKRKSKPKQRYSPPDQSTPKPPKRRSKNRSKRNEQSPSVTAKRYQDPVGLSIRKGKELGPIPRCQYCKNGIPHNRWRVINRVKRKGNGYDVKQIHMFHAKLVLSDDEFELLLILLKSSSDAEVIQNRTAWIQSMHQGMGKGAETGQKWRSSLEWFNG
jgi:hypothetical protein